MQYWNSYTTHAIAAPPPVGAARQSAVAKLNRNSCSAGALRADAVRAARVQAGAMASLPKQHTTKAHAGDTLLHARARTSGLRQHKLLQHAWPCTDLPWITHMTLAAWAPIKTKLWLARGKVIIRLQLNAIVERGRMSDCRDRAKAKGDTKSNTLRHTLA